jgi:hypothetical protein
MGMLSPVEGKVLAINEAVLASPELLCSDPYGEGWLLKVQVPDRKRNQTNLLCGGLARTWMEEKVRAVRARAQPAPMAERLFPESGVSPGCGGFARTLAPENWDEVAGELLLSEE